MNSKHLIIFDTTLRDGEQSPGAAMSRDQKILIARQLERLGVDVIEAGFPAASIGDFSAVRAVAQMIKDSTVCALARASTADVERAAEAIRPARSRRIHTFIATSPIHMEKKLKMTPKQVLEAAVHAITLARKYTDDVEFSAEDAVRSDFDFLCTIYSAAIRAGARTLNVPDTVGYSIPEVWGRRMRNLIETVEGADTVIWSTHCHNDLGLAVANSLAAVSAGARQVECTVNGLGERAGNAALEEIVMAVRTRADLFNCDTRIQSREIVPASRLVSQVTGYPVQPNKAIVGANAFAHESGIHQDGVIKHRETYEIMRAEDVGWTTNRLTLGKLSGRNAFKTRLTALGVVFSSDEALSNAFERFKTLADKKREVFDEDLISLVEDENMGRPDEHFRLLHSMFHSESGQAPVARLQISVDGNESEITASGSGPVDATFKAIEQVAKSEADLLLYSVNAITTGTDAQGEVTVRLSRDGRIVHGQGSDTDIVVASAKAYLNALNKLFAKVERLSPQV